MLQCLKRFRDFYVTSIDFPKATEKGKITQKMCSEIQNEWLLNITRESNLILKTSSEITSFIDTNIES